MVVFKFSKISVKDRQKSHHENDGKYAIKGFKTPYYSNLCQCCPIVPEKAVPCTELAFFVEMKIWNGKNLMIGVDKCRADFVSLSALVVICQCRRFCDSFSTNQVLLSFWKCEIGKPERSYFVNIFPPVARMRHFLNID